MSKIVICEAIYKRKYQSKSIGILHRNNSIKIDFHLDVYYNLNILFLSCILKTNNQHLLHTIGR